MSNILDLQDALLKAVDSLTQNRIDKLQLDKTITVTIIKCNNALTREYKCSYNGGTITCYAKEGETYTNGQNVYVLIPQNDMTKKKIIVGLESAQEDDGNISFVSSALSDYNLIGKNIIQDNNKVQPVGLHSYLKEEYKLLYQYNLKQVGSNPLPNMLEINIDELNNNIKEAEAIMIEASFQTRLPKVHRYSTKGIYGLQFVLAYADRDKFDEDGNPAIKYLSYTIDSNNMTGNPFNFLFWSEQYQIYPVDVKNFLYIDSILFFEKDFVEKSSSNLKDEWGPDIFLKNIEFYGLKRITGVNGNYRLNISMPLGNSLYSLTASDKLEVNAKFTEKGANLSDNTTFYWFKEDNRVTSTSENYQMYGGAGWARLKEKGINYHIELYGNENKAYENKYLCVAVYKEQVILKEYFTIYNESAKRALSITSSLGVKFSFDRGIPTLTCLIDNKESDFEAGKVNAHPDNYFKFVWSKVDQFGNVIIFNETKEELQKRYDQLIGSDEFSYSDLSTIRNQIQSLENVSWDKNKLTYAVNHIDSQAKFKCSVYLRDREPQGEETIETIEYNIGSAEITLQNENAASPTDYYIMIENGDQVFQYSESGVSPDDERYQDPLEIKPLICHFYDPAGLEVNNKTYKVKWVVPLSDSMIVVPKENMVLNHATNKIEWYTAQIFPLAIDADYDYQALNNQITAIVTYQGQEYQQDTSLLFTKIGENGTNGTDIVTKISPLLQVNNGNALAIIEGDYDANGKQLVAPKYNDTKKSPLTVKALDFNLYQRNEKLSVGANKVKWAISGVSSQSRNLTVNSNGTFGWSNTQKDKKYRYQIIKGSTTWESNDYYAFYPIPVIDYYDTNKAPFTINIKNTTLLKSITYNADGRNPLYNKNQGVEIELTKGSNLLTNYYIVWTAEGGEPNAVAESFNGNPANAAFTLIKEKNAANGSQKLIPDILYDEENNPIDNEFLNKVYILPDDVYSGEYTNNIVHAAIYANKTDYQNNGNAIAHVYVPIYMSLNTYGLKSLNAWDGNHIDINQDENYILAPQIGAGVKDEENKFTGIVMGSAKTYDQKEPTVGLLGYSAGKQSILLNSEDGSAIFGLPEQQATANNQYTEGRIELIPGGESKIGQWRIGSRAIYNMTKPTNDGKNYIGVEPNKPYKDYRVEGAQISIPETAQGIILNANPAYSSYKGKPLTKKNSDIDFDNVNCAIKEGDSFEVEIDPAKDSAFSIYRHTQYNGNTKGEWRRYPLVGINSSGQFYTNAIENQESSMGIGKIGAFGTVAADEQYIGAQFAYNQNNIFKFFVPKEDSGGSSTLYLTAGSRNTNEYSRPFSMNFKNLSLFASNTSTSATSEYNLKLSTDQFTVGQEKKNSLTIPFNNSGTTLLDVQHNIKIDAPDNKQFIMTVGGVGIHINENNTSHSFKQVTTGSYVLSAKGISLTNTGDYRMDGPKFKAVMTSSSAYYGNNDNTSYLQLYNDGNTINKLQTKSGLQLLNTGTKQISMINQNSADGILIDARLNNNNSKGNALLKLIPRSDGYSSFILESGRGAISSVNNINGYQGVTISDGVGTKWAQLTGAIPWSKSRSLIANQGLQGAEFYFNTNLDASSTLGSLNSNDIRAHLKKLYELISAAKKHTDEREKVIRGWADDRFSTKHNHPYASASHTHTYTGYNGVGTEYVVKTLDTDKITYGIGGSGPNYVVTGGSETVCVTEVKTIDRTTSGPR